MGTNFAFFITVATHSCSSLDPIFISLISGILEAIARLPSPGVYEALVKAALPALCQALESSGPDASWIIGSALDLLTGIIRGVDDEKGPGEGFFATVASPLFKCLREAEDRDVLQVRNESPGIVLQILPFPSEWSFLFDGHHSEGYSTGPGLDRPENEPVWVGQHPQLCCPALAKSRRIWRVVHWRSHHSSFAQGRRGRLASPSRALASNAIAHEDRGDRHIYPGTSPSRDRSMVKLIPRSRRVWSSHSTS